MAEETGRPLTEGPEFDALRKEFLKETRFKHYPFLARLEEPADRVYEVTYQGKKVRFRKWTHGEVGYFLKLPFYTKIATNQELDPKEQAQFDALKTNMVSNILIDRPIWEEFLTDPRFVDFMFYGAQYVSGMDKAFNDGLKDFMASDLGFTYGAIWFFHMKKTPSEVANLPESDISAVTSWFQNWVERAKREVPK